MVVAGEERHLLCLMYCREHGALVSEGIVNESVIHLEGGIHIFSPARYKVRRPFKYDA